MTELQEKSQNIPNSRSNVEEKDQPKSDPCNNEENLPANQYITVIKLHNSGESTVESEDSKQKEPEQPPVEVVNSAPQTRAAHKYENVVIETKSSTNVLKEEATQQSFTSTFSNITSGSVLATAGKRICAFTAY